MDRLNADDIRALVAAGESETVELKLEREPQPDIGELLAAFANSDGGVVLFGVTDDREIVGVEHLNTIHTRLLSSARSCRPPLAAYLITYPVTVDGKQILVGQLPAPGDQVYSYGGVYRRREGAENIVLSAEEMKHLMLLRMSQDFDGHPLDEGLDAFDATLVDRLLRQRAELVERRPDEEPLNVPTYPTPEALEQLVALRALVRAEGQYRPTIAGILMVGRNPQGVLPQATVRLAAFADDAMMSFIDRVEAIGTIPDQLTRALNFIARNTRLGAQFPGPERVDQPQYPTLAVREGLVNALIHRSYSHPSAILVNLFPNHLEIVSPGGVLPRLKGLNLEGRHELRNHALAPLAYYSRLAETWGTGIRRMRAALEAAHLPGPIFVDEGTALRLLLATTPAVARRLVVHSNQSVPISGHTTGSARPHVADRSGSSLNERQRDLITRWEQQGPFSIRRAEYQAHYHISSSTSHHDLQALVSMGLAKQIGGGPTTTYVPLGFEIEEAPSAKKSK